MSTEPERYDRENDLAEDGQYVLFSDYEAMRKRLQHEIRMLEKQIPARMKDPHCTDE